jgi:hypothetical protein
MLGLTRKSLGFLLPVLGLLGCSSDNEFTADVAGTYTVAIKNGKSTCNFDNWEEGKETTGVDLTLTQTGQKVHGVIGGAAGVLFNIAIGSNELDGTIKNTSISMTGYGRSLTQGNCAYSYNVIVSGTQTDDNISGTMTYATKTNGNPDCSAIECSATQQFNGSRPPQ